jgi:hypothetical protein
MSRASLSIVLSIVSWVFLLSLPATAQTRPEKWEYKVTRGCFNESDLNKRGDEGWELINITFDSNGNCRDSYFKRPKREFFDPPLTSAPPAAPPNCNLTPAQAPVIRGIRLGMSTDELLALFPRSKEQSDTIKALSNAEAAYGQVDLGFSLNTYPENKAMFSNNIRSYGITLLDGRVASFYVYYNFPVQNDRSPNWTYKTWIPKLSETYNLPKPEDWAGPNANDASITCQGFRMKVNAGRSSASIGIIDLPSYDEQIKQRREAASERLRSEFKP